MPIVNNKVEPLELPRKHARVIFDNSRKWRFRTLHGGRNGGKDWAFASALIERAVRVKTRVLCTREIQNTIQDSIKTLLEDTINRLGYSMYFTVTKAEIVGSNGSNFIFRGLRDLNAENIKSLEGVDICMLGEAQNTTKKSWHILNPTIRKPGSEIWIQFNDQFDDDFIYDEVSKSPEERTITMQACSHTYAQGSFKQWSVKTDKTPY